MNVMLLKVDVEQKTDYDISQNVVKLPLILPVEEVKNDIDFWFQDLMLLRWRIFV